MKAKKQGHLKILYRPEILDSLNEGILSLDLQGRITQFNATAPQILGCSAQNLLGAELFAAPFDPKLEGPNTQIQGVKKRPDFLALQKKETQKNWVMQFQNPDGRNPWLQLSVIPIFEPQSEQIIRLVVTLTDVTHLKRQQELQKKAAEHRAWLLDSAGYAMFASDEKGQLTFFNKAAEAMLGYSAAEVVEKFSVLTLHDFFEVVEKNNQIQTQEGVSLEPGFATFKYSVEKDQRSEGEWTLITKSGQRMPVFLSMTKLGNEAGDFSGYLSIARDMTEELRLRESVVRQNAALVQSSKMVSLAEMAAGVAHEINNPLAVIYGKIARLHRLTMQTEINRDEVLGDLKKMKLMAERIAEIIRGMQSFSRSTVDPGSFQDIPVDTLFAEALGLCAQLFEINGVNLRVYPTQDKVSVRPAQIVQVILSLLSNAMDAVKNLPERWVRLEATAEGEQVRISITDSGKGIPQAVADKLMQPFFTTKEIGKGTGLGLSVAKGLVEDHSGRLELDRSCENTRFTFTILKAQTVRKTG